MPGGPYRIVLSGRSKSGLAAGPSPSGAPLAQANIAFCCSAMKRLRILDVEPKSLCSSNEPFHSAVAECFQFSRLSWSTTIALGIGQSRSAASVMMSPS